MGCKEPADTPPVEADSDPSGSDTAEADTAASDTGSGGADTDTDAPADTDGTGDDSDADTDSGDSGDGDDSDTDLDPDGHWGVWPAASGCSDMLVYAANAENTAAWVFSSAGYAEKAHIEGPQTASFDFATSPPGASLAVLEGTSVTAHYCVGMLPPVDPEILRDWFPVAGTVDLRVTAEGSGPGFPGYTPAVAEISLRDIQMVPSDDPLATPVPLGDQDVTVHIGWLPM